MRKTKIICTIGPASDSYEMISKLCDEGMNVARINFSHGNHSEHKITMDKIKEVRDKKNLPIPIMLDTKGPECRIGKLKNGSIILKKGQIYTFTEDEIIGDEEKVSVSYKGFTDNLKAGDKILVNNGLVVFLIKEIKNKSAICEVITGGEIKNHKSMSFPGKLFSGEYLGEEDKKDILFGISEGVDFIAASFISNADDVKSLRKFLDENGGKSIDIIAKIENSEGVKNIKKICEVADGIMIARGDLGVEIDYSKVPSVQKKILKICRRLGKRVIVATEMLESMITNIRPTRAEASDVANAIFDEATAVMLSGETAAGKYPELSVRAMSEIILETEKMMNYSEIFNRTKYNINNNLDAISKSACEMAIDTKSSAIIINSISGNTARIISKFRNPVQVVGIAKDEKVYRKLAMCWGVLPIMKSSDEEFYDTFFKENIEPVDKIAIDRLGLRTGDRIVITGGYIEHGIGKTNMIMLETIK